MKKSCFMGVTALSIAFLLAICLCVRALFLPQAVFSAVDYKKVIVLDAGHGGVDGGVRGVQTGVKESDLNLAIVLALKSQLEEVGFEVVLTRKTKDGLYDSTAKGFKKRDMQKRKEIIQRADPALVISIHQNFYPSKSLRGAQVFYASQKEESGKFATLLQEKLNGLYAKEKVKARNAMQGDFFMLTCAFAPSVIVECGFLSNAKDEKLLGQVYWQNAIVQSILSGVLAYFSQSSL